MKWLESLFNSPCCNNPSKSSKPTYTATFYRDKKRETRWRLTHRNGNIVADSGEGYKNKGDAKSSFVNLANVVGGNQHITRLYRDKKKELRWNIAHINGNIVADSGEGYKNLLDITTALYNLLTSLSIGDFKVVEE